MVKYGISGYILAKRFVKVVGEAKDIGNALPQMVHFVIVNKKHDRAGLFN